MNKPIGDTIYINYNGYACPFESMPCHKCKFRYAIVCPQCSWGNKHTYVNLYHKMTKTEIFLSKGIKDWIDIYKEENGKNGGI